jgi:hypothetical protein
MTPQNYEFKDWAHIPMNFAFGQDEAEIAEDGTEVKIIGAAAHLMAAFEPENRSDALMFFHGNVIRLTLKFGPSLKGMKQSDIAFANPQAIKDVVIANREAADYDAYQDGVRVMKAFKRKFLSVLPDGEAVSLRYDFVRSGDSRHFNVGLKFGFAPEGVAKDYETLSRLIGYLAGA